MQPHAHTPTHTHTHTQSASPTTHTEHNQRTPKSNEKHLFFNQMDYTFIGKLNKTIPCREGKAKNNISQSVKTTYKKCR